MYCSRASLRVLLVALVALCSTGVLSYQPNQQYYGAGRRIAMSSIRTLTLYAGRMSAYRRTSALPQLTCVGTLCSHYQPDVVQCTAMGDEQWKCSADLPATMRMGRVQVSCGCGVECYLGGCWRALKWKLQAGGQTDRQSDAR